MKAITITKCLMVVVITLVIFFRDAEAQFQTGDVFVSVSAGQVKWYRNNGTFVQTLNTGLGGFTTGMAIDSDGLLYVTNFSAGSISMFDRFGILIGLFPGGAYSSPESIVFDAASNVYVGCVGSGIEMTDHNGANRSNRYSGRVDFFDLKGGSPQCIIYRDFEGTSIETHDVCNILPGQPYASGLGGTAFALRIIPVGPFTDQVLLANGVNILRLNPPNPPVVYDIPGHDGWFALNLDPDGCHFWSADYTNSNVHKFDIESGNVSSSFNTGTGSTTVFGLCLMGELTSATVLSIDVEPKYVSTKLINTQHCITATVTNQLNVPQSGVLVNFTGNSCNQISGSGITNNLGQAQFCYTGTQVCCDTILATVSNSCSGITDTSYVCWDSALADTTCMRIVSDTTYCDSTGTYIYEFRVRNNSPTKYIEQLEISVDSPQPPDYVVTMPSTLNISPPVPPLGVSGVQRVKLVGPGAVATAEVCYTLSAHFVHDDCPWCCFIENCIKLPICGTCAEVIQDSIYCSNGNYFYNFTLQNGTIYDVSKIQLTSPGTQGITFVPQTFHFTTPIAPGQVFPNRTAQILGGAAGMNFPVRIKLFSGNFECCYFELPYTLPSCDTLQLNLGAFIQGRYDQSVDMMIGDTIEVELRNTSTPYALIEKAKGYLNDSGKCSLNFHNAQNNVNYYIVLKHRNSIETWSTSGNVFNSGSMTYDFTTASNKAYGNNVILVNNFPVRYAIYSGDVDQNGYVDGSDASLVDSDGYIFVSGYAYSDVTGDEIVDASDAAIVDNNGSNFIFSMHP